MPDTGGVHSLVASYLATDGGAIEIDQHNPVLEDISSALTARLSRSGAAPMTGNLAMGSNKITGLAAGTASGDAVRFDQLAGYQPLDADLTAIAALTTTTYGRALLALADQAALQAAANVEDGATADQTPAEIAAMLQDWRGAGSETLIAATAALQALLGSSADFWKYSWHPYDKTTFAGSETGEIWEASVDGAVANVETPTFEAGYDYRLTGYRLASTSYPGSAAAPQIALYRNSASAYDSNVNIGTGIAGGLYDFDVVIRDPVGFPRHTLWAESVCGYADLNDPGDATVQSAPHTSTSNTSGITDFTTCGKLRFQFSIGSIRATAPSDTAKIVLQRKLRQ